MSKYIDVMFDLETLGKDEGAIVVQIGAVHFDRRTREILGRFKENISIKDSLSYGLKIEPATMLFWLRECTKEAQLSVFGAKGEDGETLKTVLQLFYQFVSKITCRATLDQELVIWCHNDFDTPKLRNLFSVANIPMPFNYRCSSDLRTVCRVAGIDQYSYKREGVFHDSIADCEHQIGYLCDALDKLETVNG